MYALKVISVPLLMAMAIVLAALPASAHNYELGATSQPYAGRGANIVIDTKCSSQTTCPKCDQTFTWSTTAQSQLSSQNVVTSTATGSAQGSVGGAWEMINISVGGSWTGSWSTSLTSSMSASVGGGSAVTLPTGDCEQFGGYFHWQYTQENEGVCFCNSSTTHCAWDGSTCSFDPAGHIAESRAAKIYTLNQFCTFDDSCHEVVDGNGAVSDHTVGTATTIPETYSKTDDPYSCSTRHSYVSCITSTMGCATP